MTRIVDWEVKLLVIVVCYAFFKLLRSSPISPSIVVTLTRAFFLVAHIGFFYLYRATNAYMNRYPEISGGKNNEAHLGVQSTFRTLCARAFVAFLVHIKLDMLPPLVISAFIGFCSMIENKYYSKVLQG